jgi:antitoxin HicB
MRTYTYRAAFEPGDEGSVVVTFPDVPEAITQGADERDARIQATDALATALLTYLAAGRSLPKARARGDGLKAVTVAAADAAKLAVIEAFQSSGLSKSELARRLRKDEREIRRILDPMHATKLPALSAALDAFGQRLVVGVEKAA